MNNSLTKLEFEKGIPFIVANAPEHGKLFYQPNHDNATLRVFNTLDYLCMVDDVKEDGFVYSYHFLNEPLQGFIKFKDCITQTKNQS